MCYLQLMDCADRKFHKKGLSQLMKKRGYILFQDDLELEIDDCSEWNDLARFTLDTLSAHRGDLTPWIETALSGASSGYGGLCYDDKRDVFFKPSASFQTQKKSGYYVIIRSYDDQKIRIPKPKDSDTAHEVTVARLVTHGDARKYALGNFWNLTLRDICFSTDYRRAKRIIAEKSPSDDLISDICPPLPIDDHDIGLRGYIFSV